MAHMLIKYVNYGEFWNGARTTKLGYNIFTLIKIYNISADYFPS